MDTPSLFPEFSESSEVSRDVPEAQPRVRRPDRRQVLLEPVCLDERLAADHPARTVWELTGRLDLRAFYAPLKAAGEVPGRPATDPRLLVALWLFACIDGVGHGRKLTRLCERHDAYRWLCGGVPVNYHTLNDFRVGHAAALDHLFTQVLATLLYHDVVQVRRIAQDGTRVRASAGTSSFRRRPTLEQRLAQAQAHVAALKQQADEASQVSAQQQAARERVARERLTRLQAAMKELPKLEAIKTQQREDKPSKKNAPRVSTTDPEARRMKMADGGFRPAYNVQIGSDPQSRAIVEIDVTNHGTDHGEDQPLRARVERRSGRKVHEQLLDGGYVKLEAIEQAAAAGVAIYAPLPETGKNGAACTYNPHDPPGVAAWRARMIHPASAAIYKQRGATAETINGDLKTWRGLRSFGVRGLAKCRCVALWSALAHNLMHFAAVLLSG
jgi:transposase